MTLAQQIRFFGRHAGYVGQRMLGALHLARAETYTREHAWSFEWAGDDDGDLGDHAYWCDDERAKRRHSHEVYFCTLRDEHGAVLGSLGGIIDPTAPYTRVIEAEIASEALAEIEARHRNDVEASSYLAL